MLLGTALVAGGCGERPPLVELPAADPRGGSVEELTAAAHYASGLDHAWTGRLHQALADLRQADRLAPDQPLILAAIGFALDDLAHPEPDGGVSTYYNGLPNQGILRREELDGRAFVYLNRAAELKIDDERVYERLAAHWHRVARRPEALPGEHGLSAEDRRQADGLSAHYSFLALAHLAGERDSELSRQKAMVYITHLTKFFQQRGQLEEELAVVRIHRQLEPADWTLQLDEVELLYLTERQADADRHLGQVETELAAVAVPAPVRKRLAAARRLGQRVQAAAVASGWPRPAGDPAADLSGPLLRWLTGAPDGLPLLWDRTWRDFPPTAPVNPCGP